MLNELLPLSVSFDVQGDAAVVELATLPFGAPAPDFEEMRSTLLFDGDGALAGIQLHPPQRGLSITSTSSGSWVVMLAPHESVRRTEPDRMVRVARDRDGRPIALRIAGVRPCGAEMSIL